MKSGLFRSTACAMVLLLAACDDNSGSAPADTTAAFTAAADALAAKLKAGAPAASDPAVKAFDAESGKALQTLGTPALPLRGFDSYDDLCGKTATLVSAYVGLGIDKVPAASQAEVMSRNVTQYLDQMFNPLLFSAHCSAAHMPFLEKMAGDDVSDEANLLQQVRVGAYSQVSGLLQMAADSTLDAPRRRRIVDLLAADVANFAIVLSPGQRKVLAADADAVRATLPDADKSQADKIKAGFVGASCGPFCKI
ncbi:MAG: hypothetical protein ACXWU6_13655 [Allosphingosinicella sp.]